MEKKRNNKRVSNRQFVIGKYPRAFLDFVVVGGTDYGNTELGKYTVRPRKTFYDVREHRFERGEDGMTTQGKIIARGATTYMAWRNAKRNIIKAEKSKL